MREHVSRTPWTIAEDEGGLFIMDADGYEVARLQTAHKTNAAADAPVLAAAPDLLEACRRALSFVENTESEHGITLETGDVLRAAIAAAEGNTP